MNRHLPEEVDEEQVRLQHVPVLNPEVFVHRLLQLRSEPVDVVRGGEPTGGGGGGGGTTVTGRSER